MYSPQRTDWWSGKSLSPAHQQAYDTVADQFTASAGNVIIDLGCGTGELLRRVYAKYEKKGRVNSKPPLLIGIDGTLEMIETAKNSLSVKGIESKIIKDPSQLLGNSGVVLMEGDFLNREIPEGIADFTIMTFPQLVMNLGKERVGETVEMITSKYGPFPLKELEENIGLHTLAYHTKKGGHVILVDYALAAGKNLPLERRFLQKESQLGARYGLNLVRAPFFRCPEVIEDFDEREQKEFAEVKQQIGYRVLFYLKK